MGAAAGLRRAPDDWEAIVRDACMMREALLRRRLWGGTKQCVE